MICNNLTTKFSCLLLALTLAAGTPVLPVPPARAAETRPVEQTTVDQSASLIIREYADDITYNHPVYVDLLQGDNYLVSRVGFRDPSVQKVDPAGNVVWTFKGVQPASAVRLANGNTLVADTGAPGPPHYPRVMEISPTGAVVWEHRFSGMAESPRQATALANGNVLVTLPFMVVELDRQHRTVWSYGSRAPQAPGSPGYLERPVLATGLSGGNVLVVDRGFNGGRVLEINKYKQVVWQFGYRAAERKAASEAGQLGGKVLGTPGGTAAAKNLSGSGLASGAAGSIAGAQTLSASGGQSGGVVAAAAGSTAGTSTSAAGEVTRPDPRFLAEPSCAVRLPGGNTLINDLGTCRLLEVDRQGNIVREADWSAALQGYPVMNVWQAVPAEDKLLLVLTLTSSRSRVLELDAGTLPDAGIINNKERY